jgi:hypothetical protein
MSFREAASQCSAWPGLTSKQEEELASVNGGTGFGPILKEMFTVAGNRRRVFISVALMCAQQVQNQSRRPNKAQYGY